MAFFLFFDFVVVLCFWFTLSYRNWAKTKASGASSGTYSSSSGTQSSTGSGSGSTKKHKSGSDKIEEHSRKLIQKAVMRIAWYFPLF